MVPEARAGTWRLAALGPAVFGLAASAYLTAEHFSGSTTLACPDQGAINCAKVTTSSYSHVAGVPVAVAGLAYFAVMIGLLTGPAWRVSALDRIRLVGAAGGVAAVVYLVWAELFRIDAICLWCTAVHVCTVAMFAGIIWHSTGDTSPG
jgi:uncharacterized membrane protein